MSDFSEVYEKERKEINSEAAETFLEAADMSIEEVEVFVEAMETGSLRDLFDKMLAKKEAEAMLLAFPEDTQAKLLTHEGYLEVAGVKRAIKIVRGEIARLIGNYKLYQEELLNVDRKEKA